MYFHNPSRLLQDLMQSIVGRGRSMGGTCMHACGSCMPNEISCGMVSMQVGWVKKCLSSNQGFGASFMAAMGVKLTKLLRALKLEFTREQCHWSTACLCIDCHFQLDHIDGAADHKLLLIMLSCRLDGILITYFLWCGCKQKFHHT